MADYLSEEEQVAAIKSWWAENGTSLIIGVTLVIAAVVGYRWYQDNRQDEANAAAELYQSYLAELDRSGDAEDSEALASLLARVDQELPDTAYQTFTLFYRAKASVEKEDYDSAIGHLESAVSSSDGYLIHDLALIRLAKVYQQVERQDDALASLNKVNGKGYISVAEELKGDIHRLSGDMKLAHEAYQKAADLTENLSQRPLLEIKLNNTVATNE